LDLRSIRNARLALPNLPHLSTAKLAAVMLTPPRIDVAGTGVGSLVDFAPEQAGFVRELCGRRPQSSSP
jgi:hypothetical protein